MKIELTFRDLKHLALHGYVETAGLTIEITLPIEAELTDTDAGGRISFGLDLANPLALAAAGESL